MIFVNLPVRDLPRAKTFFGELGFSFEPKFTNDAAGGSIPREPQDLGFMYGHAFEDPDGHIWELAYMAPQS